MQITPHGILLKYIDHKVKLRLSTSLLKLIRKKFKGLAINSINVIHVTNDSNEYIVFTNDIQFQYSPSNCMQLAMFGSSLYLRKYTDGNGRHKNIVKFINDNINTVDGKLNLSLVGTVNYNHTSDTSTKCVYMKIIK